MQSMMVPYNRADVIRWTLRFKFIIIYLYSNNIYIGTLLRPSPSEISKIEKSMKIIYTNKLITM